MSEGPRQVSLQLKAAKPSLRHSAIPSGNLNDGFDLTEGLRAKPSRDSAYQMEARNREVALVESEAESSVGSILEQAENGESLHTDTTPAG